MKDITAIEAIILTQSMKCLRYLILPIIFLLANCASTPRSKPSKDFSDEERFIFYRDHVLTLNENEPLVHKNFLFFTTAIMQGGKKVGNARDVFAYYPETAKKYREEWQKWDKSWMWGIGGLAYGTLGILGFSGVIDFAPFWNYLFTSLGGIGISVSAYTFLTSTPDYESLIPMYNDALSRELLAQNSNHNKVSFVFRFN